MSRIADIKALQIAAAEKQGKPNPYCVAESKTEQKKVLITVTPRREGRIAKIKAAQMAEAEKTGIDPYFIGVDPAQAGSDKTVIVELSNLPHYQDLLKLDLAKISKIKVLEEKAELKAALLPQYQPFVTDYMEQGHDYPNDVAVQVMIWLIDSADVENFLTLAFYLIKSGYQHMPERFKRQDLETFVCDAMYDWANELLKQQQSVSPYLDQLATVIFNDQWDVHPLCASKIFALLAKHKELSGDYQEGIDWCEKAKAINPEGHGCKKLQVRLEKLQQRAQG